MPSYRLPTPYDKGEITKLEKEVAEIKQTTKETHETVNQLKNSFTKLDTLLTEQAKYNDLRILSVDKRVSSLEGNQAKIVWVIITAVLGGLLSLIII